jgi:flagellar biosynthesis anti-sigma factor FlgM
MVKLDGFDGLGRTNPTEGVKPTGEAAKAAAERVEPPQPGDRVEFSDTAKKIAELSEKAAGMPDVRREKVEAIRQSLEEGVYEVDPRLLAKAMVGFEDAIKR